VLRHIETRLLLLSGDADLAEGLENGEKRPGEEADPTGDDKNTDDLTGDETATTTVVEEAVRRPGELGTWVGGVGAAATIGVADVLLASEETGEEDAPSTAESVHRSGGEGVVDLELEEERANAIENDTTNITANDGSPRLNDVGGSGDGDEADKGTVATGNEIPVLVPNEGVDDA